ncbi:CBS domain containing-hemolysin-like protein [Methanomicrobium sp. W14]|uniref:hemolysin family protein n=1 Tax=Methanomicrobium sp. W14 TaxID=2817839 RepID=UPI001AE77368|nr:hemolysin family protein [Methanomicrobium sp. W14]MBP2132854.1 CBS domain containing-hemolysin-like protein [Methanomicrobium sp. W14]
MIEYSLGLFLFILCLMLSAFFSGSEIALVSINQAKVRTLLEINKKGAKALSILKGNVDHLLITILIGNNIVNIAAASIATAIAIDAYGDIGIGIATGVVTVLMLIFGEIGPKTYSARYPEKVALFVSKYILIFSYILTPVLWVYDGVKRVFKIEADFAHPVVTEEEIKQWIDVGEESGTIEEEEHEMLYRVFRFTDTIAREAMTPRGDVKMVNDQSSLEEAIDIFNETGFTRIPVYHEQVDNITGVLNVKDVFSAIFNKKKDATIPLLKYEPVFVPESKKIDELLNELQIKKTHLAIVVDEYGTYAGVITMEDILEELVGEILDEFDEEEPQIQKIDAGIYLIDAGAWVTRINEELEIDLPPHESYETLGGLLIDRLGHIPKRGEVITLENGIKLQVMKMRGRRIVDIRLTLPDEDEN